MRFVARSPSSAKGFSMLEMVMVIAMIAILAALALPSYLERIVKQQIEASLPIADIAKAPIAAAWAATQTMPADNTAVGLPAADKIVGNFVSEVAITNGAIDIKFGNRANPRIAGKILTLRPAVVEDAPVVPVAWICGRADVPKKMTVKGVDKTNIPDGLLPLSCIPFKRS